MSTRLEHRPAADLTPAWLGQRVTVTTLAGDVTAVLSDYTAIGDTVFLYMGGHTVTVWPATTVTRGELDVPGVGA